MRAENTCAKWAHVTCRLIESYYVASCLVTRNLLLANAEALLADAAASQKKADQRKIQAGRLLSVTLEFPTQYFGQVRGRDILQEPTSL